MKNQLTEGKEYNICKKIIFLVPHLSTGGMPQYVYWLVKELLDKNNDVFVIEFADIAPAYVVQKNRLKDLLNNNLITLYGTDEEKSEELFKIIDTINPDIIHLQEFPEMWLDRSIADKIYSKYKKYRVIETSHDSGFNPESKKYFPDGFAFISDFHPQLYKDFNIPYEIIEYPVVYKERPNREDGLLKLGLDPSLIHILNVGLFTPRKNQKEIFEIANKLIDYKIQFHFVGNQADNFRSYWGPLMQIKPENCVVWGERGDVDNFYSCMDAFLFTSKGSIQDRETNPLVIKEALGWKLPIFMYNLPVYCGMYNNKENVIFLENNIDKNCEKILQNFNLKEDTINIEVKNKKFKIAQILVGGISVPPNGWGAIEEIIWNYKIGLEKLGHTVDFKYPLDDLSSYDIVHCHAANQAIMLKERNIPYFFTTHDIHPYLYGDKSQLYHEHIIGINNSVKTFSPNKFFIPYFNNNKVNYLSHGVNTDFYCPKEYRGIKNILCVAANGKWNDEYDCKGFILAYEAAKKLNYNITLAGPNEEWFKNLDYDLNYDKLMIINKNLNKKEMRELYHNHDVLFNLSTNESGQPNLVILEALACGLPVLCTSIDDINISGLKEVDRNLESILEGFNEILKYSESYYYWAIGSSYKYTWDNVCKELEQFYINGL